MRGILCDYSATGNTALAASYAAKHLPAVQWLSHDLIRDPAPDLAGFDALLIACPTDFWSVPERALRFLRAIPLQPGKPALILTTFGLMGLFALRDLGRAVRARGFKVLGGHSLHTPENYPPMIVGGMAMEDAPTPKEQAAFDQVLGHWNGLLQGVSGGKSPRAVRPGENLFSWVPAPKRTHARKDMGAKHVDAARCVKCGTCMKGCPYQAIQLTPLPGFDQALCRGCWRCFNRCPQQAIYTDKFRTQGRYPRPAAALKAKMG